jgi:hypothetical protein
MSTLTFYLYSSAGLPWFPAARAFAELLAVLPHDGNCRPQPNADTAALVHKGALGGNASNNIIAGHNRPAG